VKKRYALTLFFLLGSSLPVLRAETARGESIEWVVADSDCVVVGRITKVTAVAGDDKKPFEVATVKVSKTLKGPRKEQVTFLIMLARWQESGSGLGFRCFFAW
jgi:hypothetical protein